MDDDSATAAPTGAYSVALPRSHWYPACRSTDLRDRPRALSLMDRPIVVFRDAEGAPVALVDRCAHRNYPLSRGRVAGGQIECGYHGWRYDGCGNCVGIPGLLVDARSEPSPARRVGRHAATEADGFVWIWGSEHEEPLADRQPFTLPSVDGPGTGEVVFEEDLECTMHASLENALDVPHTAFVHGGIFRGRQRHRVTVVRRDITGGVEAQYIGEPAAMGPLRLPATSTRTFDHWDRFILPSIAQIEYSVEGWFRIVNTIVHLPLSPFRTRAWFVVRWWSKLPPSVVRPLVLARGKQILRQDAKALAWQTASIRRAGGERYASSELDVLGNAIWRLLRQAEKAENGNIDTDLDTDTNTNTEPAPGRDLTVTFEI